MRVSLIVVIPVSLVSLLVLLSALPDNFRPGSPATSRPSTAATPMPSCSSRRSSSPRCSRRSRRRSSSAATTRIVADAYVGRADEDAKQAINDTWRRLLPLIGVSLVVTIAVTAGIFACIVPGLWLQTAWCVAVPVLMLERTGVLRSIGRSFELTKVRFWLAFGVFWLSQLLVIALSAGLTAGLGWVIRAGDSPTADVIAQSVGNAVASILTIPFAATAPRCAVLRSAHPRRGVRRADDDRPAGRRPRGRHDARVIRRLAQAVDPDSARADVRDILDDRRFRSDPAPRPFRGPLRWLGDRLEPVDALDRRRDRLRALVRLARDRSRPRRVSRSRGSCDGSSRPRRARGPRRPKRARPHAEDPSALERAADAAERDGDLERAVRLRFRAGLLRLGDRGAIEYRPSLTTSEVRALLGSDTFDHLAATFEHVAYGGRPRRPPDVAEARTEWPRSW